MTQTKFITELPDNEDNNLDGIDLHDQAFDAYMTETDEQHVDAAIAEMYGDDNIIDDTRKKTRTIVPEIDLADQADMIGESIH